MLGGKKVNAAAYNQHTLCLLNYSMSLAQQSYLFFLAARKVMPIPAFFSLCARHRQNQVYWSGIN